MPHITIKTLPGKTPEMKQRLVKELETIVSKTFEVPVGNISISIQEVENDCWDQAVVEPYLKKHKDTVVKFPDYPY